MTDVNIPAPDDAQPNSSASTISLLDALSEPDEGDSAGILEIIRIGTDASFVSLFTEDAVAVAAHYLEATETWAGTYAQCTGDGCPACKAGLTRTDYLLLPVVDRLEGAVKVLRMNRQKGPGKLLTELGQALKIPNRDDLVIRITRNRNFVHRLEIEAEVSPDPEVSKAVHAFSEQVNAGVLDLRSIIPSFAADDLATHERVAKVLSMKGKA